MRLGAQQVAFTWDDLPAHSSLPEGQTRMEIAQSIVRAMQQAKLPPAYGFVNGIQTEREPASIAVLDFWHANGLLLGNHTWSHMDLRDHSAAEFEADIEKNEPLLSKEAKGGDWHWLRFPYLDEGDTAEKTDEVRRYLAQHRYRIAAVTMSFGDYAWNEPYARCVAKHDEKTIRNLEESYLAAAADTIQYTRIMAKTLYGHDIPYVLLMHIGALDAQMLPKLLKLYREQGFSFITLEQAEADPFYTSDLDPARPRGVTTLEGEMYARHLPLPPHAGLPDLTKTCR